MACVCFSVFEEAWICFELCLHSLWENAKWKHTALRKRKKQAMWKSVWLQHVACFYLIATQMTCCVHSCPIYLSWHPWNFLPSVSLICFSHGFRKNQENCFFCKADINMFPKHLKWPFDCFSFYDSFLFNFYSKFSFLFFPVPPSFGTIYKYLHSNMCNCHCFLLSTSLAEKDIW